MNTGIARSLLAAVLVLGLAIAGVVIGRGTASHARGGLAGSLQARVLPRRPSSPPPSPTLTVSGVLVASTTTGNTAQVQVLVDYSAGTGVLVVATDATVAAPPSVQTLSPGHFRVTLATSDRLPVGAYRGNVGFRVCSETPCVHVLANGTTSRAYRWYVAWGQPGDWETFQRDAAHSGYVPVAIRAAAIRPLWTWQRTNEGAISGVNTVVSAAGKLYVSDASWFADVASLYALDTSSGALAWKQDFLSYPSLDPPAVANGRVFVATTGQDQTFLWSFDASDGTPRSQSTFSTQWSSVLAPTIASGVVYTNGGYFGGGVYAFAATDGLPLWSAFSGDDDMSTPAVANGEVYFYDGASLRIHDAFSGALRMAIADPDADAQVYSYNGAPMIGAADSVTAFSGDSDSGWSSADAEQHDARPLVNFTETMAMVRWRTVKAYKTHPAVADGVIYAGSDNPKSLDAISEATGQILWSWVPGVSDVELHRNIVVTKNLVFVSTDRAVYAIDLATHLAVWSWPTPGSLMITGDGVLVINEGAVQSTGRLLAFKVY